LVHGYTRRRGSSSSSRPLARVVPPDLDVDARRSHRTDRDDPRASRASSLAPPTSFFSLFCFNFGGGLSVSFPVAVDDARAAGRTHASSFPSSSPSRSLGRASARARRLRAVDEGRRRRLEGGSALVEVIRG